MTMMGCRTREIWREFGAGALRSADSRAALWVSEAQGWLDVIGESHLGQELRADVDQFIVDLTCFVSTMHSLMSTTPGQSMDQVVRALERLQKRFPQRISGGSAFVLKMAKVVKEKKTQEGLDLTNSQTILGHLATWCERMCKEHSIGPGSEAGYMHVIKQSSDAKDQKLVKVRGGALGRHGASERAREIASID